MKNNLPQDNIFCQQKVPNGNCRSWSRHLVAETRGPSNPSALPTKVVQPSERISCTEHTTADVYSPKVSLGEPERETDRSDRTNRTMSKREQQETEKTNAGIQSIALEEMSTTMLKEEGTCLQKMENLHQAWQNQQTDKVDEFDDFKVLAEEMAEAAEKPNKDTSVRRVFPNWLSGLFEDRFMKRFAKSSLRDVDEGDEIYRASYMASPMTQAARERSKMQKLPCQVRQRQRMKNFLNSYRERCKKQKELLKVKEEERFEKWMLEHDQSVPDYPLEQPKKRMSKWEKRFLRAEEFFLH
ncbi:hypothetical protein Q8A73_018697 [Channa argus]|nr:hypothetical protein Q8A73_018697 [Channa argus]